MRTWKPGHVMLIWGASAFLWWFVSQLAGRQIERDTAIILLLCIPVVPFVLTWMWLSRRS